MKDETYARDTTLSVDDKSMEQIEQEIEQTRASMSDTLNALGNKLSPGQLMDEVLGYFRSGNTGTHEFAANLGRTLKNNPIPVALVGIGLGWLILGGSEGFSKRRRASYSRTAYPSTSSYSPFGTETAGSETFTPETAESGGRLKESMEKLKASAHEAWDKASGAAQAAGERIGQAAHQARERVGQATQQIRDQVGQTTQQARDQVGQTTQHAREQMGQMAQGAQSKVGEAASAVRNQAGRLSSMARHQSERAQEGFTYMLQERPLVLGAVGLAAGAVLGAMLPPTRREDELMGRTRDELWERAETIGKEQLHKAERVVDAVQEAVREEAREQGLTPGTVKDTVKETVKEQISQVQQKVGRIAEVAVEMAKEEAERQNLGAPLTGKTKEEQQPDFEGSLRDKP